MQDWCLLHGCLVRRGGSGVCLLCPVCESAPVSSLHFLTCPALAGARWWFLDLVSRILDLPMASPWPLRVSFWLGGLLPPSLDVRFVRFWHHLRMSFISSMWSVYSRHLLGAVLGETSPGLKNRSNRRVCREGIVHRSRATAVVQRPRCANRHRDCRHQRCAFIDGWAS